LAQKRPQLVRPRWSPSWSSLIRFSTSPRAVDLLVDEAGGRPESRDDKARVVAGLAAGPPAALSQPSSRPRRSPTTPPKLERLRARIDDWVRPSSEAHTEDEEDGCVDAERHAGVALLHLVKGRPADRGPFRRYGDREATPQPGIAPVPPQLAEARRGGYIPDHACYAALPFFQSPWPRRAGDTRCI
jgi:hypothetical protein